MSTRFLPLREGDTAHWALLTCPQGGECRPEEGRGIYGGSLPGMRK
jgi:hypothetical protein